MYWDRARRAMNRNKNKELTLHRFSRSLVIETVSLTAAFNGIFFFLSFSDDIKETYSIQ
jgi:hypothetical protein